MTLHEHDQVRHRVFGWRGSEAERNCAHDWQEPNAYEARCSKCGATQ